MSLLQIGKRKKAPAQIRDRIYLSVSSEGFGHSSRALAMARYLDHEQVVIGTYNYALDRVRNHGYTAVDIPQEVRFVGEQGSFDVSKTIWQNTRALGFNQIIQEEVDIIKQHGISLVVADGRMAAVLAASRLDIPCLVMTNQSAFYPFFERESELVRIFGRSFEWVMKLWLCSAEEILIPDFPPPETVCLPNLSPNYQVKKRTRFVGPLVAWTADEVTPIVRNPNKPFIVASLGGHQYRRPLFDALLEVARQLPSMHFEIIANFAAESLPDNVVLHTQIQAAAPYFKAADMVITQAGHSTAMELLTLGKPSLIIPDTRQIEQENNAARLAKLGVSEMMTYDDLLSPSQPLLKLAIERILSTPSYQERAQAMAAHAAELHGAKHTAQLLQDYAHRLLAY